jgi:hypothetical protein
MSAIRLCLGQPNAASLSHSVSKNETTLLKDHTLAALIISALTTNT